MAIARTIAREQEKVVMFERCDAQRNGERDAERTLRAERVDRVGGPLRRTIRSPTPQSAASFRPVHGTPTTSVQTLPAVSMMDVGGAGAAERPAGELEIPATYRGLARQGANRTRKGGAPRKNGLKGAPKPTGFGAIRSFSKSADLE
jgi:hypothetical protein